ncbi:hypothetical protein ANCCAN_08306 [Ancylostoma caninum]|uniref:Uncharacterized protein n=1 Tax=Ancylostoma caninum TaxID=29170 RepID=A0A368GQT2_ANCCA|nr:hypothetical protein ANCCAN_08306 [Ancylostoma caninum]
MKWSDFCKRKTADPLRSGESDYVKKYLRGGVFQLCYSVIRAECPTVDRANSEVQHDGRQGNIRLSRLLMRDGGGGSGLEEDFVQTPAGAKLQSPLLDRQPSGKVKSAPRKKESGKAPPPAPPEGESTARGADGANFQPIHVSGRPPNRKDGEAQTGENVVPLLTDQEIRVSKEGGADMAPHERPDVIISGYSIRWKTST